MHTPTGSEATGGMVFGLSSETPILQNLMCNGSEYTLSDCLGYDLNGVSGDYCLSGAYQAGVRCLEGRDLHGHLILHTSNAQQVAIAILPLTIHPQQWAEPHTFTCKSTLL